MSLRYLLFLACLLYLLLIIFAYYSLVYNSESNLSHLLNAESTRRQIQPKILPQGFRLRNSSSIIFPAPSDRFISVSSDVYVYSIHLDIRNPQQAYLRIMFLKPPYANPSFWCHYPSFSLKERSQPMTNLKQEKFRFYELCENHNMPYGGYMGVCYVPSALIPSLRQIAVTPSETYPAVMENGAPESHRLPVLPMLSTKPRYKFGLCVPAIFGELNAQHMFEFISVVHQLGVQHITMYITNAPSDTRQVLQHFENLGVLRLVNWKLPTVGRVTWNEAQILNVNDCLHRAMSLYEYALFHDIDEYLVPRKSIGTLDRLVEKHWTANPDLCGICFLSAFFTPSWQPGQFRISSSLSRTNTLSTIRTKCMVQPRRIYEMGIHHISKPYQEHYNNIKVKEEDAILHHYRACDSMWGMNCNGNSQDDTLLTHFQEANVDKQWLQFKTLKQRL